MPIRTPDDFLVFGSPLIEDPEIEEVVSCLKSAWIGTGPRVHQFETQFAAYMRADDAVALNSCTAALHLSLLAADLGPGAEVITTPLTFCSTVNAIIHAGATPVLADIDPHTMNIDPVEIERRLTPRTRAILPVHFAGRPCDMDSIMTIAHDRGLKVIEDCAHAIETEYKGHKVGTIGDFGCFSFYATKNVVTGEGGMVLAQSADDLARIKVLGLHGMSKDAWRRFGDDGFRHYEVVECGFKYNMMDLQAALGIHQLQRVERNAIRREDVWRKYSDAFSNLPIDIPTPPENGTRHARHLYTILIDENRCGISRDAFLEAMQREGIGVGVHYLSIPEHRYYRDTFGWRSQDYPVAESVGRRTVSLPLSAKLSDRDSDDVISAVTRSLNP